MDEAVWLKRLAQLEACDVSVHSFSFQQIGYHFRLSTHKNLIPAVNKIPLKATSVLNTGGGR